MKWFKMIKYFICWLLPIYISTFVVNIGISGFLTWYYNATPGYGDYTQNIEYYVSFPPLTEKVFLLIWILGFGISCFLLILVTAGCGKDLNLGDALFPMPAFIANQAAASAFYIIAGVITGHKGALYFHTVYLCFVINEFKDDIITDINESLWTFGINIAVTLIFTAVAVFFYMKERNRQQNRLEREAQHRAEVAEANEKA